MHYTFRLGPEFVWFVVVSVLVTGMQFLVDFDATSITDWRVWAVGVGSGLVRAVAAAVLVAVGQGRMATDAD